MLKGRTALIVEGEFLIALDIQRMLEALNVGQTLFARNAAEAHKMQADWPDIALAVVELKLDQAPNRDLTEALRAAGIPVVMTAAERQSVTAEDGPIVFKPIPEEALASAVRTVLATSL
jgi:CheY-like chemotaxis protein